MDRSVLIQKTVRDNSEDLQNFMRDLKHWESDMKRKDAELSSKDISKEFLPPVRSKPRKEKKTSSKKNDEAKNKRISSFDYSSWEKFDVDKACEEIDNAGQLNKNETESDSESDDQEELDRIRQEAMYEKGLGNDCVKKEKWKEAIEHYTKAIKCFDKDAIFYANRALCYLKTNQFKVAEEDCTKSLELDSEYVKAYQRRAAARIALKKFKDAQSDLNTVLKLEPNNTQAKRDLDKIKTNEKLLNKKPVEKIESSKTGVTSSAHSASKTCIKKPESVASVSESSFKKDSGEETQEYPWGPVDPARIIKPVHKPPHLRSKLPLKRIEIIDVDGPSEGEVTSGVKKDLITISPKREDCLDNESVSSQKVQDFTANSHSIITGDEDIGKTSVENDKIAEKTINTTLPERDVILEVPPPARTSVQFYLALKKLKDYPDLLYQYLKSVDGKTFPKIFQDSLESDAFSSIINILSTEFIKNSAPVLDYLVGLINIRRFEMLVLFMNKQDKEGIKKLIDYCTERREIPSDDALFFKEKFKLSV